MAAISVYDQVLDSLAKSGATLYVFGLGTPTDQRDRAIVLDQGTADSGGEYSTLLASNALGAHRRAWRATSRISISSRTRVRIR